MFNYDEALDTGLMCWKPDFPITNCVAQNDKNTCDKCKQGYGPSNDRLNCIPLSALDNCLIISQTKS